MKLYAHYMILIKPITKWEKIFLDTGIIFALLFSESDDTTDVRSLFVRKLIDFLSEQKTIDKKERIFQISTITITEILWQEDDAEKITKILNLLNSSNVEFVDFDLKTALQFNAHLRPYLSNKKLNRMAESFGFKTHEYMMAREWITRDFMIIESAISVNSEIILTWDKNTFAPICEKLNVPFALAYPEKFEHEGKSILNYMG